ncbi:MAG: EAL domain-containing protein [Lachnospiraceae bacterium]|nr:EAL domain-containing protein [Lachnospiraceae bacterium]
MQIWKAKKTEEEKEFSFDSLIDKNELQHIQDEFCAITGTYVYAVDATGEELTKPSKGVKNLELIQSMVTPEIVEQAMLRVSDGSLEDIVVEDTGDESVKVGVIAVRIENKTVFKWVVSDVITQESSYYIALDLLHEISDKLVSVRFSSVSAEAENLRSKYSESRAVESLAKMDALTQMVRLLDSEDPVESVMNKILAIVGKYLKVSCGQIYQVNISQNTMDVLGEWVNDNAVSFLDRTKNLPVFTFLPTEKPLVIGSDALMKSEYAAELKELNIRATMIFPLLKKGDCKLYICISQLDTNRIWQVEEVKFISDAIKVLQSIMAKKIQKNSLESSHASMEMMLDSVGCCICITDAESGEILFANKLLKNTFGKELKEGIWGEMLKEALSHDRKKGVYELFQRDIKCWYDLMCTQITWVDGRKAQLYSLYDISDKKVYQRKIEQQAYTDFLTGLYNRMCCERDLAWHIDETQKNGTKGGILYLDLDDFKHINDGLGHQYGDALLKSISSNLRRIEGIRNTCYRMGGDEFVIVIPPESFPRFEEVIEDIKRIFAKPWFLKDADYYCTMSMGVVTFPDDGDNVQDLIKKADIAMYEAKKTGKNRIAKYNDHLESGSGKRLDMEKNMRDAAVSGLTEFEVYYQPITDISREDTPCVGAEALIRWNSTELGFVSPAEFIPLAEYLGLINPIGNHVLREACKTCKYWNEHGKPNYKVNVNLSVVQLLQPDIVDTIRNSIEEIGINPRNLTLEVTESLAINDMDRMRAILGSIKSLGVRIALDDFGTGYSSLNHIREIPFDVLKVDQSFVKELAEDAYSQSFIKMVAELAATLGVSICVEGIETEAQYRVLEGMKVRMVQGFYFDRPLRREEFERKYL